MQTKVSEKKLFAGLVLLAAGIYIILKTPLVATPVLVSEKSLLLGVTALCLMVIAFRLIRRSIVKV